MGKGRVFRERYGIWASDAAWLEVEARLTRGATAVLPIGAGAKEHGPHLPLNTDFLQAQWVGEQLIYLANVVVWPTLSYGYYPAFISFPGSTSLSNEAFTSVVNQISEGIFNAGAKNLLIINTGISTIDALEHWRHSHAQQNQIRLSHIYHGEQFKKTADRLREETHGGHAGELETSLMLAIAPEFVHMYKAEICADRAFVTGPFSRDPKHPNFTPSGVYGDPTLATREKGEQLCQAILQDIALIFDKKLNQ